MRNGYPSLSLCLKRLRSLAGALLLALGALGVEAQAAPKISSISPESGTATTRVTIKGKSFGSSQGGSRVTFGGLEASRYYQWSDTRIQVRPPAGLAAGTHAVVVRVGNQASGGVDYTVLAKLTAFCLGPGQTIAEPEGSFEMGVHRSGPTEAALTVTVTYSGTATHGSDYRAPETLTIAAGERRASATLEVIDDAVEEGEERIKYQVSADGYRPDSCRVTLEDNDTGAPPAPEISGLNPASGAVGTSVEITGTNFGVSEGTSTVEFAGTEAEPSSWSETRITAPVPEGARTGAVVVTVDGVASNGAGFTVGEAEDRPMRLLCALSVSEPSGSARYIFAYVGSGNEPAEDLTVTLAYSGTATHETDYTAPETLTIPAGRASGTMSPRLAVVDDRVYEGEERIELTATADGYEAATCTITLEDDETVPVPAISGLNPAAGPVGTSVAITGEHFGSGGSVSFAGTAAEPSSWSDTSIVAPVPAGARTGNVVVTVGGVASAGVPFTVTAAPGVTVEPTALSIPEGEMRDYTVVLDTQPSASVTVTVWEPIDDIFTVDPTRLIFSASSWGTPKTVTVTAPEDDNTLNESHTLVHSVSSTDSNYNGVSVDEIALTAEDNDVAATPAVRIDPSRLTVPEGGTGSYTVVLDTQPSADVTISVAVPQGASITAEPSSLTFTSLNWDSPQTVTVEEPEDDDALDETYSMIHRVTNSGSDYSNPLIQVNVIEVTDNDTPPEPGVSIDPARLTVTEGQTGTYTVVLTAAPTADVTVSGTVPLEADFTAEPSSLTFTSQNWNRPQTVRVTAFEDDDAVGGTHSIDHGVSSTDPNYFSVFIDLFSVTVVDNDVAGTPGVRVSPTRLIVPEGETGSYTVVLNTQPASSLTMAIEEPSGGEVEIRQPSDRRLTFTTDNWNVAQTVQFEVGHDEDGQNEVQRIRHRFTAGSDADYFAGGITFVTIPGVEVGITDDDIILGPGVTMAPASLTIPEGETETYTLALNTQPTHPVTVVLEAPSDGKLSVSPESLAFTTANWSAARTVRVTAHEDGDKADGTMSLGHRVESGDTDYQGVAAGTVQVSVTDDDDLEVEVRPTRLTILEGGEGTYTLVMVEEPPRGLTVTPTAPSDGHLQVSPASVEFTSGENGNWNRPQTVRVTALQDPDAVPERLRITHEVEFAASTVTAKEYVYVGGRLLAIEPGGDVTPQLSFDDVRVEITDDEGAAAELTVSPERLTIAEGGTGSYTVVLNSQPTHPVTVRLGVSPGSDNVADTSITSPSSGSLSFSTSNWNRPQTVSLSVAVDADTVGETEQITHRVSSNDPNYTLTGPSVEITITEGASITATPNPCTIVEDDDVDCEFTIQWAASPPTTAVQIWVSHNGDPQTAFTGTGTTSGSRVVTWIQAAPHTYTFNLYDLSNGNSDPSTPPPGNPLASVVVTANGNPAGFIWANPNPCTIEQGSDTCTTEIVWTSRGYSAVRVWVSHNGATAIPFTETDSLWGRKNATIRNSSTFFVHDYSTGGKGASLKSVVVSATPVVSGPHIDSLDPTSGTVGTTVTITGTNFGSSGSVRFNGTTASTSRWSDTSITATVPSRATTGDVVVRSGGRDSNPVRFTVIPDPHIDSLDPTSGTVGTTVTITGTNFGSSGSVRFNGTTASTSRWSDTSITATVPEGATTGDVVVRSGGRNSNGERFRVIPDEGDIRANPNPCTIPSNGTSCGTTLSWTSTGRVVVRDDNGNDIVTNGPSSGTHRVTGITETRVTYSLYKFSSAKDLPFLDSVEVYGVRERSGSIWANPNPCEIASGQSTCTTTIGWSSSNTTAVQVWVTHRQGSTTTTGAFTGSGTTSGSQRATWIQATPTHSYTFSLYDLSNGNANPSGPPPGSPLASVSVTGRPAPPPPPAPSISGIWPSQGETDTRVRISGANFGNSQGTVSFGGSSATIESWTSGMIVALVPLYLPMGPVEVTVTVPGNTQPSNPVNFTVTGNPFNRDPEECEDPEDCPGEEEEDAPPDP